MNADIEKNWKQYKKSSRALKSHTEAGSGEAIALRLRYNEKRVAKIEVGHRHLYLDKIILFDEILSTDYEEIFDV